jgi:EAL domain-containing protein (putative c-di-GMP-specific phosphodiesterase class I)
MVTPAEFIALAEETGGIIPLGSWRHCAGVARDFSRMMQAGPRE